MTLSEALETGKTLRRSSVGGTFLSYEDYLEQYGIEREDVLAVDWEVCNELSEETIKVAWNKARSGYAAVKPAGESPFYREFIKQLFS